MILRDRSGRFLIILPILFICHFQNVGVTQRTNAHRLTFAGAKIELTGIGLARNGGSFVSGDSQILVE